MATVSLIQPQDLEAEKQVLGACLLDREAAETVRDILSPADFYLSGHSVIFEAILHVLTANKTPDLLSVSDRLRGKGQMEAIGGVVFLASLPNLVSSTAFAKQHARIIEKKSISRKILSAVERVKAKAYNGDFEEPKELLTFAESEISGVELRNMKGGLEHVGKLIPGVMMDLEERYRKKSVTGIPTGYSKLTAWLAGYQNGDLILLAARPSMGKTTWAIQEAATMALTHGKKVAIFSLEMSRRSLVEKLLVNIGMVSAQSVRVGTITPEEWAKIGYASAKLLKAGVYIDDSTRLTTTDISHRCHRMKAKHGLDMVIIDYIGLLRPARKAESRRLEVSEISRDLKELAKELNIPVMALSQLSRECEKRPNKRPMLSDLRESGDLEQDADVIMFLYRDEYYNPNTDKKGMAEVLLSKQRNGPTGIMELSFMKECTKFVWLAKG